MFLRMVEADCMRKKWLLGQNGGTAGPETKKKAIFVKILNLGISYNISVLKDP